MKKLCCSKKQSFDNRIQENNTPFYSKTVRLNSSLSDFNNLEVETKSMDEKNSFQIGKSLKNQFFKFFNKCEPLLEKFGSYIDWSYFQEHANTELSQIKVKTFYSYRNIWFQEKKKISYSKYVKDNGLHPFSRKKQTKYSSLGPQPINLQVLIKSLIDKEERWVKQYDLHEISNNTFNGTHTPAELSKMYKNRNLHRWYGFIYILFQKVDIFGNILAFKIENGQFITKGKFVIGFSTTPWTNRWYHYKMDALKYGQNQEIHRLIRELIKTGVNIDDAFGCKILEFCWTDSKLRIREDYWIDRLDAKNSLIGGLNTFSGGSGGNKVSIPRSILIPYIAKGLWQEEIRQLLIKKYKIPITSDILRQRIIDYWGCMEEARRQFLKPILKFLLKHGYSSEYLGTYVFNRSRRTISNWCKEFWCQTFEEKSEELLKEYLMDLIIHGLEYREIDERVRGIPWSTINDHILKWWGGLKPAREKLMKPIIVESLGDFLEPFQIAQKLGYEDIERVRKFIHIFWNFPNSIKGDWTMVNKFINYIRKMGFSTEQIMYLSESDIRIILS